MTEPTPALTPIEYDTVQRFGIHDDDIVLNIHTILDTLASKTTPTSDTSALAAAQRPTPVLTCHIDCARQAIVSGCLPTTTLTDYRIFSSEGSVRGVLLHADPVKVIAQGHQLRPGLEASATAARASF